MYFTRFIDTSADPCVDFAQYACGNFSKLYPIPNDRSGYGTAAIVVEYTQTVLRTMLETAAAAGAKRIPNEQKIGDFYASCMDTDAIDRNGLKPLQAELARIAALNSKDELPELLAHYQLINDTAWFNFGEQQDFKDARRRLAPTLQLTVHNVWVKGWPWNATVIMRWSAVQDLPDGSPYNNHGVHVIRMH